MPNVIVVGAQWGDEGKAKVVDLLAHQADVVVRCQGGCNAGHTVTHGNEVYKFHLIPSGLLYPNKTCVIGPGTVIDPDVLLGEMAQLEERGINLSGLRISDRAQITLPYHRQLDAASEKLLQSLADESNDNSGKIGTTGKGIAPTYMDKVGRLGLRMTDILLDDATLTNRLNSIMAQKTPVLDALGVDAPEVSELLAHSKRIANALKPYIADTTPLLYQAQKAGEQLLFEGAQGTLLDVDHGTYPFVTSSNATSGGACTGSGVGPTRIDHTIGVMKAYTTRVGEGPFPTELTDANGTHMQTVGQEFGTTTGRQRRCGWFDGVMGLYSVMVNGLDSVALTKLDVLDDLDEVKICTGYRSTKTGELLSSFPATVEGLAEIEAVYETLPGWGAKLNGQQVQGAQTWNDLPENAKAMVLRLEEVLDCPISMVSVGPERDATIIRDPQFSAIEATTVAAV